MQLALALGLGFALSLLVACRQADGQGAAAPAASQTPIPAAAAGDGQPVVSTSAAPRALPGAGAVSFDPTGSRLAWAAGEQVRVLDLASGAEARHDAGAWITDLGFAPDGSLWVIAGQAQRWRDGAMACRAQGIDLDRLLAMDAEGVVAAGYSQSDGVGALRHQVWLDAQCRLDAETTDPLPTGVQDAEADRGAPLRRTSLQPSHPSPAKPALPEELAGAKAVAASADGRWWVIEDAAGRRLWNAVSR